MVKNERNIEKIERNIERIELKVDKFVSNVTGLDSRFNTIGFTFAAIIGTSSVINVAINVLKYWDEIH